jgi:hypothetical protein
VLRIPFFWVGRRPEVTPALETHLSAENKSFILQHAWGTLAIAPIYPPRVMYAGARNIHICGSAPFFVSYTRTRRRRHVHRHDIGRRNLQRVKRTCHKQAHGKNATVYRLASPRLASPRRTVAVLSVSAHLGGIDFVCTCTWGSYN